MKEIAEIAVDMARTRGAEYADLRVMEIKRETLEMQNQVPTQLEFEESQGVGIRIMVQGCWGFACTGKLDRDAIETAVKKAFENAEAAQRTCRQHMQLAPEPVHVEAWSTPIHHDPFEIALEEKLELLDKIYQICHRIRGVKTVIGQMAFEKRYQVFANTEGSLIEQTLYHSGVGYSVIASDGNDIQIRSYPNSFGGQWANMGYELVYEWPLLEHAERISEEAVALLSAPPCPCKKTDLILDGSQLALQIHESCGHPLELDRVLGYEANFAGTSFLTLDKIGSYRYGSDIVNLYADARPTHTSGIGTFAFDDEGVAAQRTDLVKEGILVGYLYSRDSASVVGASRSNGCMRASSWNRPPIIRMTNINLEPGEWSLDELIQDTKDGIYMETNKSWSIDDRRYNFQFGTEIAWEIKNGKKTRILKNPTYGGTTPEFWQSCDAICDQKAWVLWGLPNCGKGQPLQIIGTSHGASPARFRNVQVGVAHVG